MGRWIPFARTACVLLAISSLPTTVGGEEPDLKAIADKLPVLSPETKDLRGFSIRGELHPQEGLTAQFHVAWAAPDEAGILVTVGDEVRAPVMFGSQNRILIVDYLGERVSLHSQFRPMLSTGITDTGTISFNLGASTKLKLAIDLGSCLKDLSDQGEWNQQAGERWSYENGSKTGNTRVVADFYLNHAYPLRKLQIVPSDGKRPFLTLEEITINEPLPKFLRSFPADDARFPDDWVVETKTYSEDKKAEARVGAMKEFLSALTATAAIEHEGLRELVGAVKAVDWKQAAENRRASAPQLLKMLGPSEAK